MVEPRKKAKKITYKGIYPGAKVSKGVDWQWNEQDKCISKKGKVIEIRDWTKNTPMSAILVQWDNGNKNIYRCGYKGMVVYIFFF